VISNGIVKSACGICQIGCGVLVHMDNGRVVKVEGDPESPLNKGIICPKGAALPEYLYHPDRLQHPLKRMGERGEGKWAEISWDEALDTIATELTKVRDNYSAESVAFIRGSFKGGVQGTYLARFGNLFGSPNISGMAHVCFTPRMNASRLTYGFFSTPDFDHPPASIIIWGANPADTLHHVYHRIMKAVEKGAKLMVIDPFRIKGAEKADLWLKPRPGSDLALALAMINVVINEGLYDKSFVEQWTLGFDELKTHVQDYTPEKVADVTWVPTETIKQAARFYATNKPACIQWGNALDHGINNFQTCRALCILRAITGNLGIPGGELNWSPPPILGNLLGTGGANLSLPEKISPEVRQRRVTAAEKTLPTAFYALPQEMVNAIKHGKPYPIRAAFVMGCNPLLGWSNTQEVYQALNKLDFLTVSDMFLSPSAALADIVLPIAITLEYDNIMMPPYSLAVALAQKRLSRLGECRSEYEILHELARKLGFGGDFWDTEEQALDTFMESAGLSFDEFRKINVLVGTQNYRSYQSEGFSTPSGKAELYSSRLNEWGFDPLPTYYEGPETPNSAPELAKEYPLVLTTRKSPYFYHSGGRHIASLRRGHPQPIIQINPQTAGELGITDNDWVYIETKRGKIKQQANLSPDIDPRVVLVDYDWWFPEDGPADLYGWSKSNINILTDDKPPFGREIGTPNLRGMMCKVYKT